MLICASLSCGSISFSSASSALMRSPSVFSAAMASDASLPSRFKAAIFSDSRLRAAFNASASFRHVRRFASKASTASTS